MSTHNKVISNSEFYKLLKLEEIEKIRRQRELEKELDELMNEIIKLVKYLYNNTPNSLCFSLSMFIVVAFLYSINNIINKANENYKHITEYRDNYNLGGKMEVYTLHSVNENEYNWFYYTNKNKISFDTRYIIISRMNREEGRSIRSSYIFYNFEKEYIKNVVTEYINDYSRYDKLEEYITMPEVPLSIPLMLRKYVLNRVYCYRHNGVSIYDTNYNNLVNTIFYRELTTLENYFPFNITYSLCK